MTYNIHKGIGGVDRLYRPERIVETIARYSPDLLLLQEVDDGVPRSRGDRQIDFLGDKLGFVHRFYQPNVRLRRGVYGNGILSRLPLQETHDVELTMRPKKRRRAQIVKLRIMHDGSSHHGDSRSRTIVVANVHLGLAAFERRIQLRKLLQHETLSQAQVNTPVIIAGDFNDVWQNLGAGLLQKNQFVSALHNVRTFPAAFPLRCLDGIYYRGTLGPVRGFAGRTALAHQASDHLPLIGQFDI
jgi:endonuclease/exonuclease/phosphatase family metal-dependent hydrolase